MMAGLLYREDWDEVRARLTTWWNGGDIGRPALQFTVKRDKPLLDIPQMPKPDGWTTDYSISNFEYRINLMENEPNRVIYGGDAAPKVSPDLAPNCLALYLGCPGVEGERTVWCEPIFHKPEDAKFVLDKQNIYWQFSTRLCREIMRVGKGKMVIQFPDFIEGLDTLAALRGTDALLTDLIDRPEWVHDCLRQITDRYFRVYDIWYDMIRDERGGSVFWAWAPGRMAKFQCDFSAMISPGMFGEFMAPVLTEMTERVSYSMYHWDGPNAIPHHDHLLSIPKLTMIQWTAGAGQPGSCDKKWWPLYHKTVDAGKKVHIEGAKSVEIMNALKKEFGEKLKQFLINGSFDSEKTMQEAIEAVEF